MRRDAALADRRHEVRAAAQAWRRAGAIDDATLRTIEAAYPDDRSRLGPAFRATAFLLGIVALSACMGVIGMVTNRSEAFGVACLVFAVLLAVATEVLVGPLRRSDSGIETATALLSVLYALVGSGFLLEKALGSERQLLAVLLALGATLAAPASARWGSPVLALVAGACGLLFLARLPGGRLLWVLAAPLAAPLLLRTSESQVLPPSHRRSLQWVLVLALCAFYLAVHVGSLDFRWLEWLAEFREAQPLSAAWLRPLSSLATALVPVAVFGFAIATRRTYLMDLGIVLAVASLVTLRFYVHVAPLWLVLIAAGTGALLVTLAVRRLLASGRHGERGGFTAEPLFTDSKKRHAVEVLGAMATLGPAASAAREDRGLTPGGGRYGGGGATSDF